MGSSDIPSRSLASLIGRESVISRLKKFSKGHGLVVGTIGIAGVTAFNATSCAWVKIPALTRAWPAGVSLPAELLLYAVSIAFKSPQLLMPRPNAPIFVPGITCANGLVPVP